MLVIGNQVIAVMVAGFDKQTFIATTRFSSALFICGLINNPTCKCVNADTGRIKLAYKPHILIFAQ